MEALLLVIAGLTGSGKDAVKAELLKKHRELRSIITHTTRLPRKGEQNGVSHYFVSREEFQGMIQNGEFLEWIEYIGNYYGTSKKEFSPVLRGEDRIWRIDLTRAAQLNELFEENFDAKTAVELIRRTLLVYLDVDVETLRGRLLKRGASPAEIEARLRKELSDFGKLGYKFGLKIPNPDGKLNETVDAIEHLMEEHRDKLKNEPQN